MYSLYYSRVVRLTYLKEAVLSIKLKSLDNDMVRDIKKLRQKECKPEEEEYVKKLITKLSSYQIRLKAAREELRLENKN